MRKIRFFKVEKCPFIVAKPGLRGQKYHLSAQAVLHYIKHELLVGNNIFTVYYSHNEGIIIIGYNDNFPLRINESRYTDSKIFPSTENVFIYLFIFFTCDVILVECDSYINPVSLYCIKCSKFILLLTGYEH
jgi:hypothetical protein